MVRLPDGDTPLFDITTRLLQGSLYLEIHFNHLYSLYVSIIYLLNKIIRQYTVYSYNSNLGFILSKRKSKRYPAVHITDIDYADDIAVITNSMIDENTLLHLGASERYFVWGGLFIYILYYISYYVLLI